MNVEMVNIKFSENDYLWEERKKKELEKQGTLLYL